MGSGVLHRIDAVVGRSGAEGEPLVFVDGVRRGDLSVESVRIEGWTDERAAVLAARREGAGFDHRERARLARWENRRAIVVQPVTLAGGEVRYVPLVAGRIGAVDERLDASSDRLAVAIGDEWSQMLDGPVDREALRDAVGGEWTLGRVMGELSRLGRLGLELAALERPAREQVVSESAVTGETFGQVLRRVLEEASCFVHRTLTWRDGGVGERREVRELRRGRPIAPGLQEGATGACGVEGKRGRVRSRVPLKLIGEAAGEAVESTFVLVGGWDPSLEGFTDAEYVRSTSGDFDRVVNVFRLWVLNEDGAFSGEPFDRGPAFDVRGFFGESRVLPPAVRLRFAPTLALDDAGRTLGVVVETSLDGGATWAHFAGRFTVLGDRAGVHLSDDELPAPFIAAAKAGLARLRVTATVRNPLATEAVRWRGNPFAGPFEERRFDLSGRFDIRRVAAASRYSAEVQSGDRLADEVDDRGRMTAWLARVGERAVSRRGDVRLVLGRPAIGIRIGDRVTQLAGRDVGLTVDPAELARTEGSVRAIGHDLVNRRTEITCEVRG